MDEQQLFLFEFLVDKVKIPVIRAMQDELLAACTCVSFQILSLPSIDICQDGLVDGCGCSEGDTQTFKKGKSCLFALPSMILQRPLSSFPIKLSVYKKLPPGVLPDVMLVGCHQIEAKAVINAVLSQQVFKVPNPCQTIKDTFLITTVTGQCVGSVTVYIRASCFGKKIVTQFQIPHNRKPYLFKGTDDSPVFQCKKIPSECYTPGPLKCTCPKKGIGGSGEAIGKTCCATPIVQASPCLPDKVRQLDYGPRPCCASRQASPGTHPPSCPPCSPQARRKGQLGASAGASPCCCSQAEQMFGGIRAAALQQANNSFSAAESCPPCCGTPASGGPKPLSDLFSKRPAKKCGCPAKEYSCTCGKTK